MPNVDQSAPRILIVEDHPPTLMAMRQLVSVAFPGCRVLGAETAAHALEQCASHAPCVVVVDISLPGMDGIEATRRIKAMLPDSHVVMHSSHDLQIYRDAAAIAGASAFVAQHRIHIDLVSEIASLLPPALGSGAGNT